jgi:hypothetical protein
MQGYSGEPIILCITFYNPFMDISELKGCIIEFKNRYVIIDVNNDNHIIKLQQKNIIKIGTIK